MNPMHTTIACLWLAIILLLTNQKNFTMAFIDTDGKKCHILRAEKMLKAKCYDMNLKEVPHTLGRNIEILDLSYNRIKKLKKTSFGKYKDLRYLLLFENMIQSVEPDTFSHMTSLEEIDLSNNALTTIPLEIFNLPSLRNLYVDSNDLIYLNRDLKMLRTPIKAPLEYLNVADCGLEEIPYLGILPNFWHFNATRNPLTMAKLEDFLPMCRLKSVDLKYTKISICSCQNIFKYFRLKSITFSDSLDCDMSENSCPDNSTYNLSLYTEEYEACQIERIQQSANKMWTYVGAGLGIFIFIFIVIPLALLCYCSRKDAKRNKQRSKIDAKIKLKKIDNHKNGNKKLLPS